VEHATQRPTSVVGDLSGSVARIRYERDATGDATGRSGSLERLVGKVVDTALNYLWEGGVLVPTVLTVPRTPAATTENGESTPDLRLFGDPMSIETDLDLALRRSRRFVDLLSPEDLMAYVWAYDGFVDVKSSEAVIIEAGEAGAAHGWRLCVRYRFSKSGIALLDTEVHVLEHVYLPFCSR
jgi:hypothetical protein